MLTALGAFVAKWARGPLWSQSIGIARTFLALVGLGTMLFSPMTAVIRPGAGVDAPVCQGITQISLWCLAPREADEVLKWVAILILAVAASGILPRFTAIPMWWVLFSNQASWISVDGGDQVAAVLSLLLIPHSLTDRRRWHWSTRAVSHAEATGYRALVARTMLFAIQLQMALIYLDACVSKLAVSEWADGTAMYYWMRDTMFAPAGYLRPFTDAITLAPVPLALLTWGTLVLEAALAIAIVLPRRVKLVLLPLGLALHLGIAVMMGLWSFAFAMWAGLIIALAWDTELLGSVKQRIRDLRKVKEQTA